MHGSAAMQGQLHIKASICYMDIFNPKQHLMTAKEMKWKGKERTGFTQIRPFYSHFFIHICAIDAYIFLV